MPTSSCSDKPCVYLEDQEAGVMLSWDAANFHPAGENAGCGAPGVGPLALPEWQLMYLLPKGACGTIRHRAGYLSHGRADRGPHRSRCRHCLAGDLQPAT